MSPMSSHREGMYGVSIRLMLCCCITHVVILTCENNAKNVYAESAVIRNPTDDNKATLVDDNTRNREQHSDKQLDVIGAKRFDDEQIVEMPPKTSSPAMIQDSFLIEMDSLNPVSNSTFNFGANVTRAKRTYNGPQLALIWPTGSGEETYHRPGGVRQGNDRRYHRNPHYRRSRPRCSCQCADRCLLNRILKEHPELRSSPAVSAAHHQCYDDPTNVPPVDGSTGPNHAKKAADQELIRQYKHLLRNTEVPDSPDGDYYEDDYYQEPESNERGQYRPRYNIRPIKPEIGKDILSHLQKDALVTALTSKDKSRSSNTDHYNNHPKEELPIARKPNKSNQEGNGEKDFDLDQVLNRQRGDDQVGSPKEYIIPHNRHTTTPVHVTTTGRNYQTENRFRIKGDAPITTFKPDKMTTTSNEDYGHRDIEHDPVVGVPKSDDHHRHVPTSHRVAPTTIKRYEFKDNAPENIDGDPMATLNPLKKLHLQNGQAGLTEKSSHQQHVRNNPKNQKYLPTTTNYDKATTIKRYPYDDKFQDNVDLTFPITTFKPGHAVTSSNIHKNLDGHRHNGQEHVDVSRKPSHHQHQNIPNYNRYLSTTIDPTSTVKQHQFEDRIHKDGPKMLATNKMYIRPNDHKGVDSHGRKPPLLRRPSHDNHNNHKQVPTRYNSDAPTTIKRYPFEEKSTEDTSTSPTNAIKTFTAPKPDDYIGSFYHRNHQYEHHPNKQSVNEQGSHISIIGNLPRPPFKSKHSPPFKTNKPKVNQTEVMPIHTTHRVRSYVLSRNNHYGADPSTERDYVVTDLIGSETPSTTTRNEFNYKPILNMEEVKDGYVVAVSPDGTTKKSFLLSADNNYGMTNIPETVKHGTDNTKSHVVSQDQPKPTTEDTMIDTNKNSNEHVGIYNNTDDEERWIAKTTEEYMKYLQEETLRIHNAADNNEHTSITTPSESQLISKDKGVSSTAADLVGLKYPSEIKPKNTMHGSTSTDESWSSRKETTTLLDDNSLGQKKYSHTTENKSPDEIKEEKISYVVGKAQYDNKIIIRKQPPGENTIKNLMQIPDYSTTETSTMYAVTVTPEGDKLKSENPSTKKALLPGIKTTSSLDSMEYSSTEKQYNRPSINAVESSLKMVNEDRVSDVIVGNTHLNKNQINVHSFSEEEDTREEDTQKLKGKSNTDSAYSIEHSTLEEDYFRNLITSTDGPWYLGNTKTTVLDNLDYVTRKPLTHHVLNTRVLKNMVEKEGNDDDLILGKAQANHKLSKDQTTDNVKTIMHKSLNEDISPFDNEITTASANNWSSEVKNIRKVPKSKHELLNESTPFSAATYELPPGENKLRNSTPSTDKTWLSKEETTTLSDNWSSEEDTIRKVRKLKHELLNEISTYSSVTNNLSAGEDKLKSINQSTHKNWSSQEETTISPNVLISDVENIEKGRKSKHESVNGSTTFSGVNNDLFAREDKLKSINPSTEHNWSAREEITTLGFNNWTSDEDTISKGQKSKQRLLNASSTYTSITNDLSAGEKNWSSGEDTTYNWSTEENTRKGLKLEQELTNENTTQTDLPNNLSAGEKILKSINPSTGETLTLDEEITTPLANILQTRKEHSNLLSREPFVRKESINIDWTSKEDSTIASAKQRKDGPLNKHLHPSENEDVSFNDIKLNSINPTTDSNWPTEKEITTKLMNIRKKQFSKAEGVDNYPNIIIDESNKTPSNLNTSSEENTTTNIQEPNIENLMRESNTYSSIIHITPSKESNLKSINPTTDVSKLYNEEITTAKSTYWSPGESEEDNAIDVVGKSHYDKKAATENEPQSEETTQFDRTTISSQGNKWLKQRSWNDETSTPLDIDNTTPEQMSNKPKVSTNKVQEISAPEDISNAVGTVYSDNLLRVNWTSKVNTDKTVHAPIMDKTTANAGVTTDLFTNEDFDDAMTPTRANIKSATEFNEQLQRQDMVGGTHSHEGTTENYDIRSTEDHSSDTASNENHTKRKSGSTSNVLPTNEENSTPLFSINRLIKEENHQVNTEFPESEITGKFNSEEELSPRIKTTNKKQKDIIQRMGLQDKGQASTTSSTYKDWTTTDRGIIWSSRKMPSSTEYFIEGTNNVGNARNVNPTEGKAQQDIDVDLVIEENTPIFTTAFYDWYSSERPPTRIAESVGVHFPQKLHVDPELKEEDNEVIVDDIQKAKQVEKQIIHHVLEDGSKGVTKNSEDIRVTRDNNYGIEITEDDLSGIQKEAMLMKNNKHDHPEKFGVFPEPGKSLNDNYFHNGKEDKKPLDQSFIKGHLFFIGDGIKIPLVLSHNKNGNVLLHLDLENMCTEKSDENTPKRPKDCVCDPKS